MRRNNKKIPLRRSVAIVGDGLSEKLYFDQLKDYENIQGLQVATELPNKSGKGGAFVRVFNKAEDLKDRGYDIVYCLIDMDAVYHQEKFQDYQAARKNAERKRITVIECNPCFEIWFLLHYVRTGKLMENCEFTSNRIKEETDMSDYQKGRDYYIRKQIYAFLKDKMQTGAVLNAKWLESQQSPDQSRQFPRCEIFRVIDFLLSTENTRPTPK